MGPTLRTKPGDILGVSLAIDEGIVPSTATFPPSVARRHRWRSEPKKPRDDARPRPDVVTEDIPMATTLKGAQQRAAVAAMKEERAPDAAQAMREYEAEKLALQANTARLRALRLANEVGNTQDTKTQQPAKRY